MRNWGLEELSSLLEVTHLWGSEEVAIQPNGLTQMWSNVEQ